MLPCTPFLYIFIYPSPFQIIAGDSRDIDEVTKEWEHTLLQNSMDKELHELNKRLEEKEVRWTFHISDIYVDCRLMAY